MSDEDLSMTVNLFFFYTWKDHRIIFFPIQNTSEQELKMSQIPAIELLKKKEIFFPDIYIYGVIDEKPVEVLGQKIEDLNILTPEFKFLLV